LEREHRKEATLPSPLKLRKIARTVKTQGPQIREFRFDRATLNEEARTIELSFSSETRDVCRWFGIEVLGHNPEEVRLDRINAAGPVLVDHRGDQVGVVEKAWIDGETRKGRAVIRFSKSARGEEVYQDVKDGIRQNVSFAYDVYRYMLEEEGKNGAPDVLRAIDWEPLEISIVSMPADTSVGIGRSREYEPREIEIYEVMPDNNDNDRDKGGNTAMKCSVCGRDLVNGVCPDEQCRSRAAGGGGLPAPAGRTSEQERNAERTRIQEIQALASPFRGRVEGLDELERQFIDNGQDVNAFSRAVLDRFNVAPENVIPTAADIVLNDRETAQYSILRGIMTALDGGTCFEMEVSAEIGRKLGRSTSGMFVPTSLRSAVHGMRAPIATAADTLTSAAGGATVPSYLMPLIEILRAKMLVRAMGAQVLSGLSGLVSFPKQLATATLTWVAENSGADVGETDLANYFGLIGLTPKQAMATLAYSRTFLMQTSLDAEGFFRNDLGRVNALGLDQVAIAGSGVGSEPRGVLNTTGIGLVVCGDPDGALPDWGDIVALETDVAVDNADFGSLGYLTNPKIRGYLKTVTKFANTDTPIWEKGSNGFGELNGYRAGATTQVPSNLSKGASNAILSAALFGNWNDLVIGEYGALELIVDPYRLKKQGMVEITSNLLADVLVLRAQSFAAIKDAKSS
jgi:HK97 family phage major capsid protein